MYLVPSNYILDWMIDLTELFHVDFEGFSSNFTLIWLGG
jgi:hypothetical protein